MFEVLKTQVDQAEEFLAQFGVTVTKKTFHGSQCVLMVSGPETIMHNGEEVPLGWMAFVNVPDGQPLGWKNVFHPVVAGQTPVRKCRVRKEIDIFGNEVNGMPHYYWAAF